MPGRHCHRAFLAPALAPFLAALLATAGCASAEPGWAGPPAPSGSPSGSPSGAAAADDAGSPFWVDPDTDAARQVADWEAQGRNGDAQVLRRISDRPAAVWAAAGNPGPEVSRAARAAAAAGQTLVVAARNLPHRDCGPRPAGGARDAGAYRAWITALATAIGRTRALVVLEPGAVAQLADGCTPPARHEEQLRLLSEAVHRLKQNPGTRVYLDAGDPVRRPGPEAVADPLLKAGLAHADGFALNTGGFQDEAAVRAYGARLSRATGGRHFVVDTGRNGEGALPGDPAAASCNPPGRALGTPPTDRTGDPLVDAYLWVRQPGESDGTCRGGPAAGTWWPDYALGLARRAKDTP
ncbi:glycoside hydrolase family 6 protein [Streptomyces sp. NPDC048603]|uniref:glycoside hydrolase family 6 protein n=1 Tax=Streptomyces sp. NPDC048603 TaxID=3365577 RepID=UPI0037206BDE